MILQALCVTHVIVALITLYCMSRKYMEQHAKMKEYIDNRVREKTFECNALTGRGYTDLKNSLNALTLSLDKVIQSQQGMENIIIASLIERIDILEQKIEILKEATKKPSSQKRLNAEANS